MIKNFLVIDTDPLEKLNDQLGGIKQSDGSYRVSYVVEYNELQIPIQFIIPEKDDSKPYGYY